MGKKKSKPIPNFDDLVQSAPKAGDREFIFKWSNKTKNFDLSTFSEEKARRRVSESELNRMIDALATRGLFMYKIHSNFQRRIPIGLFFVLLPTCITGVLLAIFGVIGPVAAQLIVMGSCFLYLVIVGCLHKLFFICLQKRGKDIDKEVEILAEEGTRPRRFYLNSCKFGAYLKLQMKCLVEIHPRYLVRPHPPIIQNNPRPPISRVQERTNPNPSSNRVAPAIPLPQNRQRNRMEMAYQVLLTRSNQNLNEDLGAEDPFENTNGAHGQVQDQIDSGGHKGLSGVDPDSLHNGSGSHEADNFDFGGRVDVGGALPVNLGSVTRVNRGGVEGGNSANMNGQDIEIVDIVVKRRPFATTHEV